MDTKESSVFRPSEVDEETHPHACTAGVVFLVYIAYDEAVGDEVEKIEASRAVAARIADSHAPIAYAATTSEWRNPRAFPELRTGAAGRGDASGGTCRRCAG